MDKDRVWCSLDELAPLSQLRELTVYGLTNVLTASFAKKAAISSKGHLSFLELNCKSSSGSIVSAEKTEHQQEAVKEVFENLCPPTGMEIFSRVCN